MIFRTNNILLLLFFMVFSCINAQLELIVDFTSTLTYVNYQCGDLNVFPPCKSLFDAGERARQYVNSISSPSVNPSLTVKLRNDITNPTIIGNDNQLGNLYGFCSISVLVDQPTGVYITLDGSLSNGPFISLEEPTNTNPNIQCTAGVSMTISYLNLNNWAENEILYLNVDQTNNVATNKVLNLQNINIFNSSKVAIVTPKYSTVNYGAIKITFKLCNFDNIYSSTSLLLPPFYLMGVVTTFNNCIVSNSLLDSSELIYVETGSLVFTFNFKLVNVDVNANHPIISTLNIGTKFSIKLGSLSLNQCTFSNLLYQRNTLPSTENPTLQTIGLLKLYDCTILTSSLASNSFVHIEQSFTSSLTFTFSDISNVWDNVVIPNGKVLASINNINSFSYSTINSGSLASTFSYPVVSANSFVFLEQVTFTTNTPLVGSNSIMQLNDQVFINYSNFNLCSNCIVQTKDSIIYNNTI